MKTVTAGVVDRTMFHVSARQLGTATAAIRIAQLSRVADPWLIGLQTLTLPDAPGPDTGGLPAPGTTLP